MADQPSTLTAWRVGGQIDPAWLTDVAGLAGRTWENIRAVATLQLPTNGVYPIVDPTNGAHEFPLTVTNSLARDATTGAPSDGQWSTAPLKSTNADDPDDALQPTGCTWAISIAVDVTQGSGEAWTEVYSYRISLDADRAYGVLGETLTVDGQTCVDINALINPPLTTPVGSTFEEAVLDVLDENGYSPGGGGGGGGGGPIAAISVTVTPTGNLTSTNAQAAFAEIQGDIDNTLVPGLNALNATINALPARVSTSAGAGDVGKIPVLNSSGQLDASFIDGAGGGGGSASPSFTATASESITAGLAVNVWNDAGTLKARKADAALAREAHGFAAATASSGAEVTVVDAADLTAFSGLTPAASYWLGSNGLLVGQSSRPTATGSLDQHLGFALSATKIRCRIDPPTEIG